MTAVYEIRVKSRAGALQEVLTGALGDPSEGQNDGYVILSYTKGVNEIGSGAFVINAESAVAETLCPLGVPTLDMQVEFWRRDPDESIDPYCDFYGFLRDREYETDANGQVRLIIYLVEQSDYLRRAIIAYPANTSNRTLFSAVATETILKTLVTRNATSSGTTGDGREANVDAWGAFVSVEADAAGGTTQTKACAWRNLYEVLREVAETGGVDFSFTRTGAQAWEFGVSSLLGTDRTSGSGAVTFSLVFGNMRAPTLRSNRRSEKTVAYAGGQGTDSSRTVERRTGTNYNATYNSYELFVNANQYSTSAGLQTEADARLEELRSRDSLSFDVIQVPSTLYGKHYFLGDLVNAYFRGFSFTPQIRRVSIDVRARGDSNPEQITVTTADA